MDFMDFKLLMVHKQCRDKGPKLYIGPWALAENVGWSEDK